ncbi:hypothetical protein EDC04DRAFT_1627841 [Pisolithus marmoratus]|nr:hypothetical protein EDC04DRAFT_1627841 [Pisolithus marmoratus]
MAPGIAAQTVKDMIAARASISFNVKTVQDYLFAGGTNWKTHKKIEDILKSDPVFDKSQRNFVGRLDAYDRLLAITKRLIELQRIHSWSKQDKERAAFILSESLHGVARRRFCSRLPLPSLLCDNVEYWDLVSNINGIQG